MKIDHLQINHFTDPLGYDLSHPTVSYIVEEAAGKFQRSARIQVSEKEDLGELIYDSGEREDICSTGFELPLELKPMTRYYWRVSVTDDAGDTGWSDTAWFETSKAVSGFDTEWQARWITPDASKEVQAAVFQDVNITKPVAKARAYMTGLGLYEFYLDGAKQGEDCLMPGFCDYDTWIQYQTYELDPVALGEGMHRLEMVLADGWYKGWYGLRQTSENYGDALAAIAQIHIWYTDGTMQVIGTDESWKARKSRVVYSGIYPGETYDASLDVSGTFGVRLIDLGYDRLAVRLSPPLTIHEHIRPVAVLHSPKGETILDMGQNMVGWIGFHTNAPAGCRIHLQMGEILQDDCFYNDNLRTAKAEFIYISDGQERDVRQHFTFYGFRYVKVEGWPGEVKAEDFEGLVIHSQMEERGDIVTSDDLVNQLVHNARWGMKGNFVDVPTDCPQRDERYGWTGDAQIFSGTACFFMDTYAFYTKYAADVAAEQAKLGGSVPDVVPVCNYPGDASTVWGDVATVLPWNVYLHSGDKGILRRQFGSMKGWVDFIFREDEKDGGRRLWATGTHYADWLALDGSWPGGVYGATDPTLIATAYYYYSAKIVADAAAVLGKEEDAQHYARLAQEIRDAYIREYFTSGGRLAVDTMTAYVVTLFLGLVPEGACDRVRRGLLNRLKKRYYHLDTGFTGTPWLCRVLSENGMNDIAYHLLMEKGYPGWLYQVTMGATTVWERWNSVMPDGKISGTEMNSLNHYSYGSIVEWMFRNMCGINPLPQAPGFKRFRLAPMPDWQIESASAVLHSASGTISSTWEIAGDKLKFLFRVPFDTRAELVLPDADVDEIRFFLRAQGMDGAQMEELKVHQEGKAVVLSVPAGIWKFAYTPLIPYRKTYSIDSPIEELEADPRTRKILEEDYYSRLREGKIPFKQELCTLEEATWGPFSGVSPEVRDELDRKLRSVH